MINEFYNLFLKAEVSAERCAMLRNAWRKNKCFITGKRIAWDHHKRNLRLRKEQRDYIEHCDKMVTTVELQSFINSQNLSITL